MLVIVMNSELVEIGALHRTIKHHAKSGNEFVMYMSEACDVKYTSAGTAYIVPTRAYTSNVYKQNQEKAI
jgi:hypothetical protein